MIARLRAFGVALGALLACLAIGLALKPIAPEGSTRFLLFVPGILVAALVAGFLPALVVTLLGAFAAEYFLYEPRFSFSLLREDIYAFTLYCIIGLGIALLAGRLAQARADVQRRAREFDTLFRMTPVGIGVAADPECRNIAVNPAFAEMLRIDTRTNASLSAPEPERPPFVVEKQGIPLRPDELPLQVAARLGTEVKNVELDVVHADGTRTTLYEFAAPLFDDEGKVRGAVGAFLDITELKQAEERLKRLVRENEQLYREAQEANRLKDEFLATLSHELRTPLNALLGWIHLLKSGHLPPEKRDRALAALERSARVQAQLTSDLLDISGVITGKLRLQMEPTWLPPLVEDVMDSLRPTADSKGVTCREQVTVHDALMLDSARIQQIITNLVANAIKFTPKGGAVLLSVRREGEELVIEVTDSGIGILPEFLPHVFERFRQADAGPTRPVGGLGLGLSIVKELAERHGGHVSAGSDGLNLGATFTVRLPARRAESQTDSVRSPGAPDPGPDSAQTAKS
jgi:signal transduction histidine kinase